MSGKERVLRLISIVGRVYDVQGQKAIFLRKGFAEFSSVVVQFTKKVNSIRDAIENNGGKPDATDIEIGQGSLAKVLNPKFNKFYVIDIT